MIIDKILDRKDGQAYNPKTFYGDISRYGTIADGITGAMDEGEEMDIKRELNSYIVNNDYNPEICIYVNGQNWLK